MLLSSPLPPRQGSVIPDPFATLICIQRFPFSSSSFHLGFHRPSGFQETGSLRVIKDVLGPHHHACSTTWVRANSETRALGLVYFALQSTQSLSCQPPKSSFRAAAVFLQNSWIAKTWSTMPPRGSICVGGLHVALAQSLLFYQRQYFEMHTSSLEKIGISHLGC